MTPDDSMELVEMVARASFKNWRDNATAKGLHMDLGMTFEDMSESEREFADRHAAAILTAIEASGRRIVPEQRMVDYFAEIEAAITSIQGALRHYKQPQDVYFHLALKACRDGVAALSASPKVTEEGTGSPSAPHPSRTA